MKIYIGFSKETLLKIGICGYLLTILFNGYLLHIGLSIPIIEMIRPILPELFLSLVFLYSFLMPHKIQRVDIVLFIWFIFVSAMSIATIPSTKSVLITVRDVFVPMFLLFTLSSINISEAIFVSIIKLIRNVFSLFLIVGLFFSIKQNRLGWEWTSEYFAGYIFWGDNAEAGLRISSGWLGFKVLGTTGSAETFGFYCAFAGIILVFLGYKNRLINNILILISLINLLMSGMKTPFLVLMLVVFVHLFVSNKEKIGVVHQILICLLAIILFVYLVFQSGTWEASSIYARLILWKDLFVGERLINIVFPHNLFYFSAGAGNSGIISFWDSTYFFLMFSFGFIGLVLILKSLLYKWKTIKETHESKFITYVMIYLGLSSITTCLFFGRNFIGVAIMLISIFFARTNGIKKEKLL